MSLHSDRTAFLSGGAQVRGACTCGWMAEPRPAGERLAADDDYAEHIEAALGADAYYAARVGCVNCGSKQVQTVLIGRTVNTVPCANCGARTLVPRNDVAEDHRRATQS